jgi:Protein of unknown function (DUF2970)
MPEKEPRNASPLEVAKAVFWSFLGIRKRAAHESDVARIKPAHVIVAGILGAVIFVTGLILIVRFVVSRAG